MPTGVAMRDVREQLFDAAERMLLRAGPERADQPGGHHRGGLAKGVLHRHFADFDAFLAELVLRPHRPDRRDAGVLREAAGTGTVAGNLAAALTATVRLGRGGDRRA